MSQLPPSTNDTCRCVGSTQRRLQFTCMYRRCVVSMVCMVHIVSYVPYIPILKGGYNSWLKRCGKNCRSYYLMCFGTHFSPQGASRWEDHAHSVLFMQQKNENVGLRCSAVAPLDLAQDYFSSKEKHTTIHTATNNIVIKSFLRHWYIFLANHTQKVGS